MRILVLSDTHIPVNAEHIPEPVLAEAKNCELCIHAGDFIDYSVYETLSSLVRTIGVCGNMDNDSIRRKLPGKKIITVEDIKIGITHGRGAPDTLVNYVQNLFAGEWDDLDMIIFGHSHQALDKTINGKHFFNPGSCTDTMFAPFNSYGILEINKKEIHSKIIRLD